MVGLAEAPEPVVEEEGQEPEEVQQPDLEHQEERQAAPPPLDCVSTDEDPSLGPGR